MSTSPLLNFTPLPTGNCDTPLSRMIATASLMERASETDALVQISLEYVEAYAQVMKHLRDFERSLAADNITTADYNGMAEAVPCCNPTHPFCVCELPPGGRNAVRLPRPLLSGL